MTNGSTSEEVMWSLLHTHHAEAKRALPPSAAQDGEEVERDDELPTVVVLRQGDISQEDFLKDRQRTIEGVVN